MGLKNLFVRIKGDNKDLKRSMADSKKSVNSFSKSIKGVGAAIAAAFSVNAIINFTKEAINLAAQAEGEQQVHDLEVITEHVITTVHDEGEAIINVARRVDDAQKASDANVNSIKRASKADIDEARVNGADAESLAIVNAVQKVS